MRINNVASGRPAAFDRTPLHKTFLYQVRAQVPSAQIVQWSYTVPSLRKFQVTAAFIFNMRETAATTASDSRVELELTPSGGSTGSFSYLRHSDNTLFVVRQTVFGNSIICKAGDILDCVAGDLSTGGTTATVCNVAGIEFDA